MLGRGDGGLKEVGKFHHAKLGVGRQRALRGSNGDHPPQSTVDSDGHPDGAAQSLVDVGFPAGYVAVVVNPGGCAGALDGRG
jgi:hypothetical protein